MTTQILLQDLFSSAVSGYWGSGAGASEVDVKIVRNGDIARDGSVRWGELPVRGLSEAEAKKASILDGDLLITTSGECGRVALVRSDPVGVCTSNFVRRIRCDTTQTDPSFAYHLLRDRTIQKEFARFTRGTTLQNLSLKKAFSSISVAVPPLEEQRRIASILDAADQLRTKRQQAIDQLDTLTNAVAVAEFVGLIDYDTLGDHLDFVTSGSRGWAKFYAESGSRFVRSQDVRLGSISEDNPAFVQAPDNAEAERTVVRQGDLLVTITGIVGRVAAVSSELDGAFVSQHVSIARPSPSLRPAFAEAFMCSSAGQYQLERAQYGQTKPGLNLTQIREFRLPVPSLSEQDRVLEKLDLLHHKAEALRRSASSCATLFGSLQQRAFRGDL